MKKNIIEAASLAAISCAVYLNVMNTPPMIVNDVSSNHSKFYSIKNVTTPSAIIDDINNPDKGVLTNYGQDIKVCVAKKMYVTTDVNVRMKDNMNSKVVKVLKRETPVKVFEKQDNKWARVLYKDKICYIYSKYISKKKPVEPKKPVEVLGDYVEYIAPGGHHRKSFMDWKFITSPSSMQYKLKQTSYIGNYGIIMNQGRYCVALGSGYIKTGVGTKFDLILENGAIIPCIAGDMKADRHTDSCNIISRDGSVAEFIVNTSSLSHKTIQMGDISFACPSWNSEISKIRVYEQRSK